MSGIRALWEDDDFLPNTERIYMRPGWSDIGIYDFAHLQLYNPPDSGVIATVIKIRVSCESFVTGYYSGEMLKDASFPESRGLPLDPDVGPEYAYAKCHVRRQATVAKDMIELGQLDNIGHPSKRWDGSKVTTLDDRYTLTPGRSLILRSRSSSIQASFCWSERNIQPS